MHDFALAVLLGLIEGVTEFLPVSSTAHLRVTQALLGIDLADGYWKMFAIVIQFGAILCVPIYFRGDLRELVATFPRDRRRLGAMGRHPLTLTLLAFCCTAIPAFLLTKVIGRHLEDPALMAYALVAGGVVMWAVDAVRGRSGSSDDGPPVTAGRAIWIGACQSLSAIFPGLSRSMATITAGELAGLSRDRALRFSFLLAIPTMVAATAYDLVRSLDVSGADHSIGALQLDVRHLAVLLTGCVVSFVVALAAVGWLMRWVRRHGFAVFGIYRVAIGIGILMWIRA